MTRSVITLRAPLEMTSRYEGRGIPARSKTFPAGTRAYYSVVSYAGRVIARPGETVTRRVHVAEVQDGQTIWAATREEQL